MAALQSILPDPIWALLALNPPPLPQWHRVFSLIFSPLGSNVGPSGLWLSPPGTVSTQLPLSGQSQNPLPQGQGRIQSFHSKFFSWGWGKKSFLSALKAVRYTGHRPWAFYRKEVTTKDTRWEKEREAESPSCKRSPATSWSKANLPKPMLFIK